VVVQATVGRDLDAVETPAELRRYFLLDASVAFLNHGSFGACPRPVFETYQGWQRELERQPVEFLGRRLDGLLDEARAAVAAYVNAGGDELVFVPNATTGLNVVARSLDLRPGDEILTTDHEYGALDLTWAHVCAKTGARYVPCRVPLPVTTPEDVIERVWAAVTPRTRVLFLSHVTSPTALTFPVAELCRGARAAGILAVVDGAHAPGHLPLDLAAIDADAYAGNCHKWLCAPKGAGFLHVRPELHERMESVTVSWGWAEDTRHSWVRRSQWQGTLDFAAYLSVPAAIRFQAEHRWDAVRARCHALAGEARRRISDLTGLAPIAPERTEAPWFGQMAAAPLPPVDVVALKTRLYDEDQVEVPLHRWGDHTLIRVSIQGYNDGGDVDRLVDALGRLLPEVTGA
jgi:isopenicillin-N epimerase